jgi:hypothetical protein
MTLHRNAKLGPGGRLALVTAIEGGMSLKAAAAAFRVSPATAHRWWHRRRSASDEARRTLCCLHDCSSRPQRSLRELLTPLQERICTCRRQTGWGPRLVAAATGLRTRPSGRCSSGLGSRVRRGRRGSLPTATSGPARATCCTWTALPASSGRGTPSPAIVPSARATGCGPRSASATTTRTRSSTTTRDLPTSSYPDERAQTVTSFLERALAFFERQGIVAQRLMTDNAFSYVKNRSLRELLAARGIKHLTTEPYRPRTNGKVEHYNHRRPHSAIGDRPPISRVHNVRG